MLGHGEAAEDEHVEARLGVSSRHDTKVTRPGIGSTVEEAQALMAR